MGITKELFGKTIDGRDVMLYTLKNSKGMKAKITNYGAIIVSLDVPDKYGKTADIVLGYDSFNGYLNGSSYFGAVIGRYGNRIEDARFELNGREYFLCKNNGNNHLHGGLKGFDKVLWDATIIASGSAESLELSYLSVDGEEGYPGNLNVRVVYSLTEDNELVIEYFGKSDADTVINLTNHSYFNLSGHDAGDVGRHELFINADRFTVINRECIPMGELGEVKGTPLDFTKLTPIGPGLESTYEQMAFGNGYDHNFVLNQRNWRTEKAAELFDPASGRVMELYTSKPGVQFYSANYQNGSESGKGGAIYNKHGSLCLETQYFPNSIKYKHFPSPILRKGEEYHHTTIYKFSCINSH